MRKIVHRSARSTHYDLAAPEYDATNNAHTRPLNRTLASMLKKQKVRTVLDLSCGTGSQVFWLHGHGFTVTGRDINPSMLRIARKKAKDGRLKIEFLKGDMRTTRAGEFDAVLTMFNAVGHLTKPDFRKAIKNIHANLAPGGYYLFDIFNLNFLLNGNNITQFTDERYEEKGNRITRDIEYCTINPAGIMGCHDVRIQQQGNREKITRAYQTLQIYTRAQLKEILSKQGFKIVTQTDILGKRFHETRTERILTLARREL